MGTGTDERSQTAVKEEETSSYPGLSNLTSAGALHIDMLWQIFNE